MSKSSSLNILLCSGLLLLTACSATPQPAPQPQVDTSQAEPAAAPIPEPVDFNQRFYEEAVAALKKGDHETALKLLQTVSQDAPDKPFVFTNLGLAYFKLGRIDEAERAFEQSIIRNDDDAVAYNHLGILLRQKGQFKEALERYQRAISIRRDYAPAHLNLGILFDIYLQDLDKALQQYERYQDLTSGENKQVAGWIVDIKRRLKSDS